MMSCRHKRYTLQSLEEYAHEQFMELQAMQELQAAQIIELQGKLDKLESQPESVSTSSKLQSGSQDSPTPSPYNISEWWYPLQQ